MPKSGVESALDSLSSFVNLHHYNKTQTTTFTDDPPGRRTAMTHDNGVVTDGEIQATRIICLASEVLLSVLAFFFFLNVARCKS